MTREEKIRAGLIVGLLYVLFNMLFPALPAAASSLADAGSGYTSAACQSPVQLAQARSWVVSSDGWVDRQYGGLRVTVNANPANPWANYMPTGWSFIGSSQNIPANGGNRWVNPQVGTLYAPTTCRANGNLQRWLTAPLPTQSQTAPQQTGTNVCSDTMNPVDLALSKGWTLLKWEEDTRYNGLEVKLQWGSSLPLGWEATGGEKNRVIHANDAWRGMESGQWTIYAPLACQASVVRKPFPGQAQQPAPPAPVAQPTAVPAPQGCPDYANLASRPGWHDLGSVSDCGHRFHLDSADALPNGYEAVGPNNKSILINSAGTDRNMVAGDWSIYKK